MADNDDMAGIHQALAETAQQINEDVTTRHRAAAIAHRQGQQVEQRTLNSALPVEAKRPVNLAPKGIPMSLILRSDPEEGKAVKFAPGELQVEEAKQEAAETRMPTLPHLLGEEADPAYRGLDIEHEQVEDEQKGTWEALVAPGYEERKCSTMEASAGFYFQCRKFLPLATPEQHFQVFGVSRRLSRQEWEVFVNSAIPRDEE